MELSFPEDEELEERQEETGLQQMQSKAGELITAIARLEIEKKRIEENEKAMRAKILEAMKEYGVKSFVSNEVRFTYIDPGTRTRIDTARLRKEMPDIAEQYTKESVTSESVQIRVVK